MRQWIPSDPAGSTAIRQIAKQFSKWSNVMGNYVDEIIEEYRKTYPPLVTVDQAAEILQRPVGTVYDWSSRGLFDAFKRRAGRQIRLIRDELVRWYLRGATS